MDRSQGTGTLHARKGRSEHRQDDRMHPRLRNQQSRGMGAMGYAGAAIAAFAGGFLIGRLLPAGDSLRQRLHDRHGGEGRDAAFDADNPFAPRYTDPAVRSDPSSARTEDMRPDGYIATDRNAPGRQVPNFNSNIKPGADGTYDRNQLADKMSEDSFPTSDPPSTY
ncbi:MAG TPA: hypothetical protein VEH84_19430 [Alphaproteobacteria bacterium]|nr:hypothetical protein [Alphaproteobacteria bacterium]